MIIALNGYPGVGKLTIGKELADLLGGRMPDIHSVYNVAFALTEFKSPEFIETVEQIEAIAHNLIRKLPPETPVIITTVLADEDDWEDQEWRRIVELGKKPPAFPRRSSVVQPRRKQAPHRLTKSHHQAQAARSSRCGQKPDRG